MSVTLISIFMRFPINTYLGEKAKSLGENYFN